MSAGLDRRFVRRVRMTVRYDGTAYQGFQVQPDRLTIQSVMETALGRLLDEPVRLRAAGRTDAGVHAREQVVDFADSGRRAIGTIVRGGNALLPADIRILSAEEVSESFDARRHAKSKEYRYFLWLNPVASPFLSRYSWHIEKPLDLDATREGLAHVIGEHDFSSFRGQGCTARSPVRTILAADLAEAAAPGWAGGDTGPREAPTGEWAGSGGTEVGRAGSTGEAARGGTAEGTGGPGRARLASPLLFIGLAGTGFLRHMVRNIVGTLVEVGREKIPPERIRELLALRDRAEAGPTAPAHGLFLWEVRY
ncbi:MAG: tRNA pseudouridine synthase A [Deltaproteobacteria bacterium]|nr:tRNA pseudouridine synthase A [Deltaproteobacteria bacterium]